MALDSTDWAAIAAWAGAFATIGGGLYTGSQARSARESLRLTREANEVALDQARSERESVQIARAALDHADRPKFEITAEPGDGECRVMVKMLDGPPAIHVTISWISESSWPTSPQSRQLGIRAGTGLGRYELVRNERIGFGATTGPTSLVFFPAAAPQARNCRGWSREWAGDRS